MRHLAEWNIQGPAPGAGYDHFRARYAGGTGHAAEAYRVVAYSLYGPPHRHAFVFRPATATSPDQRMSSRPRKGGTDGGSFYESMGEQVAEGYYPAYVGAYGDVLPGAYSETETRECLFSAIYERLPIGANTAPYMIMPAPWSTGGEGDFVHQLAEGDANGYYARSVGVVGVPQQLDLDQGGGLRKDFGLRFFATMWPKPERQFGWSVHLTPNLVNKFPGDELATPPAPFPWWLRWETGALSLQAYPVAGAMTRSMASEWGPLSLTLTLWHDVRFKPWPEGDPFRFDYNSQERSFEVIVADDDHVSARVYGASQESDRRPLSMGATKDGSRTVYFVPLGRPGSEDPLPRQAFVSGPYKDHGDTVPGPGKKGGSSTSSGGVIKTRPELDQWMLDRMKRYGARHAQLVVVRRGALVHAGAYTWAEQGYPIAKLDHAIRLMSVSKSLTAMMVLREVVPFLEDGIDTTIVRPELLDTHMNSPAPLLRRVTIRHLLTMNSGFAGWDEDAARYFTREAILTELTGAPRTARQNAFDVIDPGTYSQWFAQHSSYDYFNASPGEPCHFVYSNEGYILLGEMLAKFKANNPSLYLDWARKFLVDVGAPVAATGNPLVARGWPAARANRQGPSQARTPGHVWNRFAKPGDADQKCPTAYDADGPHSGGAGGWCIPLVWFARILQGLCPGGRSYLDRAQIDQLVTLAGPSCGASADSNQAHGVYRQRKPNSFTFRNGGFPRKRNVIRVSHNGGGAGTAALWAHQLPVGTSPGEQSDTLSFCLAFNQEDLAGLYDGEVDQIFDILQRMEDLDLFPAEDLFDVLA